MKVDSKNAINRLSRKILKASSKRNVIFIMAVAMTTLLFTAMFTIVFSLNSSYESYQFRQIGAYNHGSFKQVSEEHIEKLSRSKGIKEYGVRTYVGIMEEGEFSKKPAEISYMDANTAKWSYIDLIEGSFPKKLDEVAMDTATLELLGIPMKIGAKIHLDFEVDDRIQQGNKVSKEFTLSGYWDSDDLLPIRYINVSEEFAKEIEGKLISSGGKPLRTDMNIMLNSSAQIEEHLQGILKELALEAIPVGVNWGYSSSQINNQPNFMGFVSLFIFVVTVILTGYLIISNLFYISIGSDIRFYGLLKTIGVTSKQLKRIVYHQVLLLCFRGAPLCRAPDMLHLLG